MLTGVSRHGNRLPQIRQERVIEMERFQFGRNWRSFLSELDEERIGKAENSLREMLEVEDLSGMSFLDVGCGSGLFSLAARRMGARVHSFDYDPESAACARELKRKYFPEDSGWTIGVGSVLDPGMTSSLRGFDIVYAWGVLHHTGDMWRALENILPAAGPGGRLFLSIYNDQGGASRRWRSVKKLYNRLPGGLRFLVLWPSFVVLWWRNTLYDILRGRPGRTWREYRTQRGMSPWRDVVDWVGGYPFEVARPEEVFDFLFKRGFTLLKFKTVMGGTGCNEFIFEKPIGVRWAKRAGEGLSASLPDD